MGQCQAQKSQQKIDIFHIPVQDLRSDMPPQTRLYQYPHRNIKLEEVREQNMMEGKLQGLKRQKIAFHDQSDLLIELQSKKYDYLSPALLFQNEGLQICQILSDELQCDRIIYLVKHNRQSYSIAIRNFKGYQSRQFIDALYEINSYEAIDQLQSPHLHRMVKNYTIQSNNQFIPHHSKVIVFEPVAANLSLIIRHRRTIQQAWTLTQFYVLMMNLVQGLSTLHSAGLVHTDIRPSNIYYSNHNQNFMLGSFGNIKFARSAPEDSKHKKDGFYKDLKKRKGSFHVGSLEEDNKKSDVYSLGMTLLAAFYLVLLIDRKKAAPFNRQYHSDYPILQIITKMVCKIQKRMNIFEVQQLLTEFAKAHGLQSNKTLQLQDYSEVPQKYMDIYKRERFIADGYKMLSLVGSWKDRLKNKQIHKMISDNSVQSAKYYEELAIISNIQGKIEKSKNYYIHSAEIYYKVGTNNFIERDFQNAAIYFREGLDNFTIIENKQTNLTYLRLLVSLYQTKIVSGHELVGDEQLVKLWSLVLEVKKVEPFAFWQYGLQIISIFRYYQNYSKIREVLEMCRQVSGHIETKIGPITLHKMIIQNNLKVAELASKQNGIQRRAVLSSTELNIFSILNDKQYYFISHPLEKIELNLLSAKLKLQKGATRDAITALEELASSSLDKDGDLHDAHKNKYSLLKSQVFAELGHIWLQLEDLTQSFKYYSKAVDNYKQYYGDIYNIECALLIQKMAEIYKKKKNYLEYSDSMNLVLKILKTEYGKYHKDILRLSHHHKRQFDDKQMTLTSFNSRRVSESDLQSITS